MLRTKEKEVVNEVVGKRKHQPTKIGYFAIVAEVNAVVVIEYSNRERLEKSFKKLIL